MGVELHKGWVKDAKKRVAKAGLGELVRVVQADCRDTDFSDATVVYMFMTDKARCSAPSRRRATVPSHPVSLPRAPAPTL